jgi:hypothetical protein
MLNDSKIAFAVKWEDIEKATPVSNKDSKSLHGGCAGHTRGDGSGLSLTRFSKLMGLLADRIAPRQEVQRIAPHRCEG